jgi:hypothetical protein
MTIDTIPLFFAIVYPKVGSILSVVGAISGLFIIYIIPVMCYLKKEKMEITNPVLAAGIREVPSVNDDKAIPHSPISPRLEGTRKLIQTKKTDLTSSVAMENREKALSAYNRKFAMHMVIIVYGVGILILQFIPAPPDPAPIDPNKPPKDVILEAVSKVI